MTTLLLVEGEASGDLHGAEILQALKGLCPELRIVGIAGDRSSPYLDRQIAHVRDLGMVGFVEVLRHLPALKRLQTQILSLVAEENIQHVLTVDYPGFNLRLAKALRKTHPGIHLHHYVCPQVWAWKKGRIPEMGNCLDTLYCLFDFEPPLFEAYPVEALCLGNPLVDVVRPECSREDFFRLHDLNPEQPLMALLPGSRPGEVKRLLPPLVSMVRLALQDPNLQKNQWALVVAPTLEVQHLRPFLADLPIRLIEGMNYAARAYAQAAVVASGTATLETALLGTPFVAVYRLNPLSLLLARCVVTLPHFALANVVAGEKIVPELLQGEVNPSRLLTELRSLLAPERSQEMRTQLGRIGHRLGQPGAAQRVAQHLAAKIGSSG